MPRFPRFVVAGLPHHVVQRGNRRQQVFFCDEDRETYLELLATSARSTGVQVLAYCLMDNHTHLILIPAEAEALALLMYDLGSGFSRHVNRRHGWTGHLWQNRYSSCVLGERHLVAAVRYVECNPVRAGVVDRAEHYRWSSALPHIERRLPRPLSAFHLLDEIRDWPAFLESAVGQGELDGLRRSTATGRPWASHDHVLRLEQQTGRVLRKLNAGRKPTSQPAATEK